MIIYSNNKVQIEIIVVDSDESKVNVNGENLIWISTQDGDKFEKELKALLDKYSI